MAPSCKLVIPGRQWQAQVYLESDQYRILSQPSFKYQRALVIYLPQVVSKGLLEILKCVPWNKIGVLI